MLYGGINLETRLSTQIKKWTGRTLTEDCIIGLERNPRIRNLPEKKQYNRDIVRGEAPKNILLAPYLPEVKPVGIYIIDMA